MTRRERHVIHQGHVPCADDVAPGPRIVLKAVNQSGNLVNGLPVVPRPAAPLRAVHGPQLPVLVSPFIPDADSIVFQELDISFPFQEPEQFVNDGAQMLCRPNTPMVPVPVRSSLPTPLVRTSSKSAKYCFIPLIYAFLIPGPVIIRACVTLVPSPASKASLFTASRRFPPQHLFRFPFHDHP